MKGDIELPIPAGVIQRGDRGVFVVEQQHPSCDLKDCGGPGLENRCF